MLILDWMQSKVISIPPTATLLQCRKLFKEHKINRLPVVDANNIVVGLISSSDVRSFAPSKSTGLEIIELLEIMSETKLSPGPLVGIIRDALLQAQIAGEVTDVESAVAFVRDYARKSVG